MATSPLFGWEEPDDVDLVKDGAAAIRTLGNAIDTSMGDLLGGTTGQVLSKASNTNMDFTWVTSDDANAIQNAIVDAKGDLISATANDTPARLAVGSNGETLVADSSTSTGLRYTGGTVQDNPILNAACEIAQRGTTALASNAATNQFMTDRWQVFRAVAGATFSRQNTSDSTNLPNIRYCVRVARDSGNTATNAILTWQNLETVNTIPFAGKTVTLSFYARAGANYSPTSSLLEVRLSTGTGTDQNYINGYTGAANPINSTATLTTTWQRFTFTGTIATTATEMAAVVYSNPSGTAGANDYYEVTGWQIDIGSVALPFRTYAGTYQAELAACQRYCYKATVTQTSGIFGLGFFTGSTNCTHLVPFPVTMRTSPSMVASGTFTSENTAFYTSTTLALAANTASPDKARVSHTVTGATALQPAMLSASNDANAYLLFTSEL